MARKDRHSLFGGRMDTNSFSVNGARKGNGTVKRSWKLFGSREANCDQYFFPQPFGTRIGNPTEPIASAKRTGGEPTHL
jgi:hypothetical protein